MNATVINPPSVTMADLEKKPFHRIADSYIGCLLGEINAYQIRERAFMEMTKAHVPDRDLKAAKGATNTAMETYRKALAEEVAKK